MQFWKTVNDISISENNDIKFKYYILHAMTLAAGVSYWCEGWSQNRLTAEAVAITVILAGPKMFNPDQKRLVSKYWGVAVTMSVIGPFHTP